MLELNIRIDRAVDLKVDEEDVVEAINGLPILKRWNVVARLLNELETDTGALNKEQLDIIRGFLERKLDEFKKNK